jgi:hypothetical protein
MNYLDPLDQLLTLGEPKDKNGWQNYLELGFTENHIKDLITMTLDEELHNRASDSNEIWAPIHAWRTLGQLKAISSAKLLLKLLPRIDDEGDDWISEEIPVVFKMLGPETIPILEHYIETNEDEIWANVSAIHSLEMIGNEYPESRFKCIEIIANDLKKCEEYDETYNAFLISYLTDLKAVEDIDVIAEAFNKDLVDLSVCGDLEEIEIELGLRTERSTPRPNFGLFDFFKDDENLLFPKPIVNSSTKIGRNDACPCGSGKKYKKCCLTA